MKRFVCAFIAALFCCIMVVTIPFCVFFNSDTMFGDALVKTVPGDETALRDFAKETLDYLTGSKVEWKPTIATPSEEFAKHMVTVRSLAKVLPRLAITCALGVMILLLMGKPMNRRGWYIGAVIGLLPLAAATVWAAVDFQGMWYWVHTVLITDGLFPASEPMMALFPVELFQSYLLPGVLILGAELLLMLGLPAILRGKRTQAK